MKKLLILSILLINSGVNASPICNKIAEIAKENASNYGDDAVATIEGKKGTRVYFHTAPSNQCKSKVFVIPNDQVTLLQDIKSEREYWSYVVFKGGEVPTLTFGWIKKNHIGDVDFN